MEHCIIGFPFFPKFAFVFVENAPLGGGEENKGALVTQNPTWHGRHISSWYFGDSPLEAREGNVRKKAYSWELNPAPVFRALRMELLGTYTVIFYLNLSYNFGS